MGDEALRVSRHPASRRPASHSIRKAEQSASYNQILEKLCTDETRNRLIAENVAEAARCGRVSLVLTKRKGHARQLAKLISQSGCKTHLLVGEGTAAQRRKLLEEATKDDAEEPFAIIATESYLGEGFDFSKLDALFLATPISWSGNVTQQAGRLHRTHKGKAQVTIWDYVDTAIPMLERMYKKRLKTYAKLGYEVEAGGANDDERARFVVASEAIKILAEDIRNASSSIEIAAPYVSPKTARLLQKPLSEAHSRGVRISCTIAKEPPQDAVDALVKAGVAIKVDNAVQTGLAIFDGETIWYGTLPLLAFPKTDDCSIRLKSPEAAHDLQGRCQTKR